jgi:hypothetical protein
MASIVDGRASATAPGHQDRKSSTTLLLPAASLPWAGLRQLPHQGLAPGRLIGFETTLTPPQQGFPHTFGCLRSNQRCISVWKDGKPSLPQVEGFGRRLSSSGLQASHRGPARLVVESCTLIGKSRRASGLDESAIRLPSALAYFASSDNVDEEPSQTGC